MSANKLKIKYTKCFYINAIQNGQFSETVSIGYTRREQTKQNIAQYVLDTTIHKQTQIT